MCLPCTSSSAPGLGDLGHACGNALVVDLQLQAADSRQGWDTSGNDSTVAP